MAINTPGNRAGKRPVARFKNRKPVLAMIDKKQQDIALIDVALVALYNDGDKVTRSLNEDILRPNKIKISEKDFGRIWDIMVNTGLVNPVIGFGNGDKLNLTTDGYQLMVQFGSYRAFLEEKARQAQQGQNMMFPQFIIEPAGEKDANKAVTPPPDEAGDGQKATGMAGEH